MRRKTGFPPATIALIEARSNGLCEVGLPGCGGLAVEIQHRRARGAGGSRRPETNAAGNGIGTCRSCHSWIESHLEVSRVRGWSVRQSVSTPADVPVLRLGQWVLLSDCGQVVELDSEDLRLRGLNE